MPINKSNNTNPREHHPLLVIPAPIRQTEARHRSVLSIIANHLPLRRNPIKLQNDMDNCDRMSTSGLPLSEFLRLTNSAF